MNTPQTTRPDSQPGPDFAGMPEFAKTIRGLAQVSKKEVDAAIAKEKRKNNRQRRKVKSS